MTGATTHFENRLDAFLHYVSGSRPGQASGSKQVYEQEN